MRIWHYLIVLMLISTGADADTGCQDIKDFTSDVVINLTIPDNYYDFSKTTEMLTAERREGSEKWLEEHGLQTGWRIDDMTTGGVTETGLGYSISAKFVSRKFDLFGTHACMFIDKLNIEIFYRSKISIAQEIHEDACTYPHVKEHEETHHKLNKWAIETSAEKLRENMPVIIAAIEGNGGVPMQNRQDRVNEMQESINKALKRYMHKFAQTAKSVNARLDTPEEYKRVSKIMRECREQ